MLSLSALRVSPRVFATAGRLIGGHCLSVSRADRSRPRCTRPIALKVSLKLTVAAAVTFGIKHVVAGRRAATQCVAATRHNRNARRCTRLLVLPARITRQGHAGPNRFLVTHAPLAPGAYRLTAAPRANGQAGQPVTVSFKVVEPETAAAARHCRSVAARIAGPVRGRRLPALVDRDRCGCARECRMGLERPRRRPDVLDQPRKQHDFLRQSRRLGRRQPAHHGRAPGTTRPGSRSTPPQTRSTGPTSTLTRSRTPTSTARAAGNLPIAGAPVSLPTGVALDPDADKIYWANSGAGTISYANLDGSGEATSRRVRRL